MVRVCRLALFVCLVAILGISDAQAQSGPSRIEMLSLDSSEFPQISLSFRALSANGDVSDSSIFSQIDLQENGVDVAHHDITSTQSYPQTLVLVIDTGLAVPETDDEVTDLLFGTADFLRDGVDTVIVLEHSDNSPGRLLFGPSSDTASLRQWIPSYRRVRTTTNRATLSSIRAALDQIEDLDGSEHTANAVIYVGQLIEAQKEGDFSEILDQLHLRANRLGTQVYSFNLSSNETPHTQRVNEIASSSSSGRYHLPNEEESSVVLRDFFEKLSRQRLVYHLEYTVPQVDAVSDHYAVSLRIGPQTAYADYRTAVDLPEILITSPLPGHTITREAQLVPDDDTNPENDRWTFNVSSVPVKGEVRFPDSIERAIISSELLVDNVPLQTLSGSEKLDFVWEFSGLTERGPQPRTLQIRVTDAFGLVNTSPSQTITIDVDIPEGVVAPVFFEQVVKSECEINPDSPACVKEQVEKTAPWVGVAILSVIVLILLIVIFSLRRQIAKGMAALGGQISRVATKVRDSVVAREKDGKPYATFEVLEARLCRGETISMYGNVITFGRDPAQTDYQLDYHEQQPNQGADQVSISGRHCTVTHNVSGSTFRIANYGRYGTRVILPGGSTVELNKEGQSADLPDNSEIILGIPRANSARLRFRVGAIGTPTNPGSNGGRIPTIVEDLTLTEERGTPTIPPPDRITPPVADSHITEPHSSIDALRHSEQPHNHTRRDAQLRDLKKSKR